MDPLYKIFTLCLQFEPELPDESDEEEEPEELANQEEEEAGEDAVLGQDEDAARAVMPPPTGERARDRPPTRRSRFWSEGEDPLSKGLPYTGRPL